MVNKPFWAGIVTILEYLRHHIRHKYYGSLCSLTLVYIKRKPEAKENLKFTSKGPWNGEKEVSN